MTEVVGTSTGGDAVSGTSASGAGVRATSNTGSGIIATGSPAGSFRGPVDVVGDIVVTGVVDGVHVTAKGNISAIGNVNANTLNADRVLCQGDINSNTTVHTTDLVAVGNISAKGNVNAGATINTTHVSATGNISAVGNINGRSANVTDTVHTAHLSATGNISALGNVNTRNLNVELDIVLLNADCAEDFDIASGADRLELVPGSVVILDVEGSVRISNAAYDRRVAGVISGGGEYRPGIVLDRRDTGRDRVPVAMMGKVSCHVDATYGPIELGDLLTSSATPGHAMKVTDMAGSAGSIIGKAMRPLGSGLGMIPILVALQ